MRTCGGALEGGREPPFFVGIHLSILPGNIEQQAVVPDFDQAISLLRDSPVMCHRVGPAGPVAPIAHGER